MSGASQGGCLSQQSGLLNQVTPDLMVFWGEWVVTKKWGSIGIEMELRRRAIKVLFLELQSTIWANHSFRDKTVIVGHTLFVQRPLSRWNRESGVFKIPEEMAKWVNNWEHKQT